MELFEEFQQSLKINQNCRICYKLRDQQGMTLLFCLAHQIPQRRLFRVIFKLCVIKEGCMSSMSSV